VALFIDSPLAEGVIVGRVHRREGYGLRLIAEIRFADFIWPVMNQ